MPAQSPQKIRKKKSLTDKKSLLFQAPKGMHDILPEDQAWWNKIRRVVEEVADFYNLSRIDTPILEDYGVFERSIGGATDILEKQMFVLKSKGGDRLALRPENTASIMRAYLEHGLSRQSQPLKLYYIGPFFRYERPQAGRYRQFHQLGFEFIGDTENALYDAQIIILSYRILKEIRLKNAIVQVNSIGCRNCRGSYKKKLQDYYRKFDKKICKDCRRRLNINPLRLLDCKNEACVPIKAEAPTIIDNLCGSCRGHFKSVLEYLDEVGLPYTLNSYLVRGLDYYNRTVFELSLEEEQGFAFGGGGRYDFLAELISGRRTPLAAVGSALGIERLVEAMKKQELVGIQKSKPKIFLVQMGDPAKRKSLSLIEKFQDSNLKVGEALGRGSLKAQMRLADKEGAELALILGQKEVFEESIIIRDMKSGIQETVSLERVVDEVKRRLSNLNHTSKKID